MDRSNLRVLTNAHAKVLRFDGKRAVGVEFWQGDELKYAQAKGEVILAAGAIGAAASATLRRRPRLRCLGNTASR